MEHGKYMSFVCVDENSNWEVVCLKTSYQITLAHHIVNILKLDVKRMNL